MKTMHTIYKIMCAAALVALAACARESAGGVEDDILPAGKPFTVKACLPSASKTTLDEDGLTLLWSAGDEIAVYSDYIGSYEDFQNTARFQYAYDLLHDGGVVSDMESYIEDYGYMMYWIESGTLFLDLQRYGRCAITPESIGQTTGTFTSEIPPLEWFGNPNASLEEKYWLSAYYPARETINPLKKVQITSEIWGVELGVYLPYYMVNIPAVQDGHSWQNYQFVSCAGFDLLDDVEGGVTSMQTILEGDKMPTFPNFAPMTSLLAFKMKIAADAPAENYDIAKIVISQEASWHGVRRTDLYALAGDVPFFPFCDDVDRDGDTPLWNRYCKPDVVGNSFTASSVEGESWGELNGLSNTITLDFSADPVTVGKSASEETYYAVAIPTNARPDDGYDVDFNPVLIFKAYDSADNEILFARLKTPVGYRNYRKGLEYGRRYDFTLNLNTLMDGAAGNAGEYNLIEW